MKWTIEYIRNSNYFRVTDNGVYEEGDTENLYRDLIAHQDWSPGSAVLRDLRSLDFRNINYQVLSQAVNALARDQTDYGSARIAYLVDSDVGYGVCRQIQMLMESNSTLQPRIFRDEEAAIAWLTSRRGIEAESKISKGL